MNKLQLVLQPDVTLQSLVPMKDEAKPCEDKKPSETTRCLLEERERLIEQVVMKNRQLKEVLDALRNIIWEINTMLAMRKRCVPLQYFVFLTFGGNTFQCDV